MRLRTTSSDDRHSTGRTVAAVASLAVAGLLLSACGGAEDTEDAEFAPETNEPGAVSTATLEADEIVSEEPSDAATTGAGRSGLAVALG